MSCPRTLLEARASAPRAGRVSGTGVLKLLRLLRGGNKQAAIFVSPPICAQHPSAKCL